MSTLTVYPSLDGHVKHQVSDPGITWAALRDGAGTDADYSRDDEGSPRISSSTGTDKWDRLDRSILLFDTSALPDDCSISAAVLSLYGYAKQDDLNLATPEFSANVYSASPASDSVLVAADYSTLGAANFADGVSYASWNTSGYNDFTFNLTGRAAISKTGLTKLGIRDKYYDAGNVESAWISGSSSYMHFYFNEKGTTYRPKLVITYSNEAAVSTLACTNTIAQKSTGHGIITDTGASAITQHGHCWHTSDPPSTSNSKTTNGAAPNVGHFTSAITGLTPGTKYYVRAYAHNTAGTAYGASVEIAGDVTTIGHREWWVEKKDFCYFDEFGQERHIEGRPVASGLPWWRFT